MPSATLVTFRPPASTPALVMLGPIEPSLFTTVKPLPLITVLLPVKSVVVMPAPFITVELPATSLVATPVPFTTV